MTNKEEKKEETKEVEEKKARKKGGKKKDANRVKKPLTAFMFFTMATRATVVEANPDIAFGDIAKKLGGLWNGMTAEEKQPFVDKAAEDKTRYETAKGAIEVAVEVQ